MSTIRELAERTGIDRNCVAYDYERKLSVAVEIESSEHVFYDHIEQVKLHMMEISPFNEVHFWAHQEAAERIMELRSQLRPEDQLKVKVFAVGEDSSI
jgi:predicted mannosyl-3-phosphoglycerate phosphatase (HAD superfamily)